MGPFNNESGRYEEAPGFEEGHWFVDEDNYLYIVPDTEAEIEGPDNDTLDSLNSIYRSAESYADVDPTDVERRLNLVLVSPALRRFSSDIGYYVA